MPANARIRPRRDTSANWAALDPVLAEGEMGVDTDVHQFKIGDGVTAWSVLPFTSGPAGPAGPAGSTGPAGSAGPAGPQGDPLADGDYGDVTVASADYAVKATAPEIVNKAKHVSNRAALASTAISNPVAYLREGNREGSFIFLNTNLSALVALDTEQGVSVAPTSDPTGVSGAWVRPVDAFIHSRWFGTAADGTTPDNDALTAWAAVGAYLNKPLKLNKGTHLVYSDTVNGSGVLFPMPSINTLHIVGEPGSVIKRANVAAGQMSTSSRVIKLEATQDGNYILENITVDGNEANVPYDPTNQVTLYQYEQAHNIMFMPGAGGSGVTLGDITTRNVTSINAVADGFSHNFPYRNAFHENFVETGRTRRVRSGMQLGVWTGVTHVKGGYMSYIENEPTAALVASNKLILEGVIATENFDLAGFSTTSMLNLTMIGCKALLTTPTHPGQRFSLASCKGEIIDCELKGTDMVYGNSQLRMNQLNFRGGSITIPVNPTDATQAVPIIEWKEDATKSYHKFHGTRFYAPSGITSIAAYVPPSGVVGSTTASGVYIMPVTNNTTGDCLTGFYDCISDENLPYFYYARNASTTVIDGGTPRGKTATLRYAQTSTFVSNVVIRNPEQFPKSGLGKMFTFGGSTGTGTITVSGAWDGELMATTSDGTNPAGVTWSVSATMLVDSTPQARIRGIPGLVAQLRVPAAGVTDEWHYRNGSTAGANNTWDSERFANMATARVLGRVTAGSGMAEELTAAQTKTLLAISSGDVSGLGAFATGTDAANLTGTLAAARIADGSLPLAKTANIAAATILGNNTGSAAAPLALTAAQTKTLLGITEADVVNLTTDLAAKAPLANPQFTGVSYYQQSAPTAKNTTSTLTIAELLTLIITSTSASAVSLTLPTGTLTDAGILSGALPVNEAFEWYLINLGSSSGAVTLLAGTGHTIVGNAVTAITTSSRWLTRKTATNTFVTYRIA